MAWVIRFAAGAMSKALSPCRARTLPRLYPLLTLLVLSRRMTPSYSRGSFLPGSSLSLSLFVVRQLIAISRWTSLIPRFEIINPLQWNGKENFQSLCIESDIETKVDSPSWRIIFKLSGFSANDNTNWSCTRGGGGLVTPNNCRSSNSEAIGSTSTSVETIGRDSSRLSPPQVRPPRV